MQTPAVATLTHFRAECYQTFGRRRDALWDLLDAVLSGAAPSSLVHYSLEPVFRRGWSSLYDALSDGTLDVAALRRCFVAALPAPAPEARPLWALDGSCWARPAAKTSPARTWERFVTGGTPESGIVGGWGYQWLVAVPGDRGSWILPLDVRRRDLVAGTPTHLAISQLRAVLADRDPTAPRPLVTFDSQYDLGELVAAKLPVTLLARLGSRRRFYRRPPPPTLTATGRPRKHGPVFRLADPTTHGVPDVAQTWPDPDHETVTIETWHHLHPQARPDLDLTVLRVRVARLPRRATPPAPLWLVWHGEPLPADLREVWRAYERRFAIEHGFRFLKQALGWTLPRVRDPATADRWSWLQAAGLWQLWLARELTTTRLPWERPPALERAPTPGQVRRGMGPLLALLGSPARLPRPRGKASGRRVGECPGRAPRYPVVRRPPRAPPTTA